MYRVELKVSCFMITFSFVKGSVPNVPCGVERTQNIALGRRQIYSPFLMYRVELKDAILKCSEEVAEEIGS